MRVLNGDRPGYAILVFNERTDDPLLRLAIKSLQMGKGAFLAADGGWTRLPHYFDAVRVSLSEGGFGYRLGPEVIGRLRENDHIEISNQDRRLRESAYWPHEAATAVAAPAPTAGVAVGAASGMARKRSEWLLPSAAAGILLLAAATTASLTIGLRCALFGSSCAAPPAASAPASLPSVDEQERAAAQQARECAARKAATPCDVTAACFATYRHNFPQGASRAELDTAAARASLTCAMAKDVQQLTMPAPAAIPSPNAVPAPTAIPASPPGASAALPDGEYLADAQAVPACGMARQRPHVFVCDGKLSWVHEAPLAANLGAAPVQWQGTVDSAGALRAEVRGNASFAASAHISDTERSIEMRYPDCPTPIQLNISRELAAGCAEKH